MKSQKNLDNQFFQDHLSDYLDNQLSQPDRARFEALLAASSVRRGQVEPLQRAVLFLQQDRRNLERVGPIAPSKENILKLMQDWPADTSNFSGLPLKAASLLHPSDPELSRQVHRAGPRWVLLGIGLAASLAVALIVISTLWLVGKSADPSPISLAVKGASPSVIRPTANLSPVSIGSTPTSATPIITTSAAESGIVSATAPVTLQNAGPAPIPQSSSSTNFVTLKGHTTEITRLAWSPDGKYLATGDKQDAVLIWDATGKQIATFSDPKTKALGVTDLAWSPDGQVLVATYGDSVIKSSRPADPTFKGQDDLIGNSLATMKLSWSPAGKYFAVGFTGLNMLSIYDRSGKDSKSFQLDQQYQGLTDLGFAPNDSALATGWRDGKVRLLDPNDGKLLKELNLGRSVSFLQWSPNASCLVATDNNGAGKIWNADGDLLVSFAVPAGDSISAVRWSPDSRLLAVRSGSGQLQIYALNGNLQLSRALSGPGTSLDWSPNGSWIAAGSDSGNIEVWNKAGGARFDFPGHTGRVNDLAWQPGGTVLASGADDKTVRLWELGQIGSAAGITPGTKITPVSSTPTNRIIPGGTVIANEMPGLPAVTPYRSGASMGYDGNTSRVVLFGGATTEGTSGLLNDTWAWNGHAWQQLHPAHSPTPRVGGQLAYDAARHQLILFGGVTTKSDGLNDTWAWDGQDWKNLQPTHSPPGRVGFGLVYDAARQQILLFGGVMGQQHSNNGWSNDSWLWDGHDWTASQQSTPLPDPRHDMALAYDPTSQKVLMFGGFGGKPGFPRQQNDTWAWDGQSWQQLRLSTNPPSLNNSGMVYDAATKRVILFGSIEQGGAIEYVGYWNGQNWSDNPQTTLAKGSSIISPLPGGPAGGQGGTFAYDSTHQMVVFSTSSLSSNNQDRISETWLFVSGNGWRKA